MALHGFCCRPEERFVCLTACQFFPNGIIGSNKRYYLFLQTWPLIFLVHCKLSEREPQAAMPYKGIGYLAELSGVTQQILTGWWVVSVTCPLT